jgi:hypothetical protein
LVWLGRFLRVVHCSINGKQVGDQRSLPPDFRFHANANANDNDNDIENGYFWPAGCVAGSGVGDLWRPC